MIGNIESTTKMQHSTDHPASPLDCKEGLHCTNSECEWRHLDVVEQQGRFRSPDKPLLIIAASPDMGRTASTWVFNAVRLLFQKAEIACDSYWMRVLSREKLVDRCQPQPTTKSCGGERRPHVLVKTHEWTNTVSTQYFENKLLPLFDRVIVSERQGFAADEAWGQVATHVVHYEDIVADNPHRRPQVGSLGVLRAFANHLDISSLTDDDLRAVDYQLMTLPIPGNQATKFWSFHARRGGRSAPSKSHMADAHE